MRNQLRLGGLLLCLVAPLAARAQVPVPKALLFPNYDNVLVGKNQALEGGAYIARANDASSNFYNPAGLVAAEKTSLNASSTGYVWSRLSSKASDQSISTSKLEGVPGYFGVVIEPPYLDMRNLRFGFSVTRSVSWSPGGIDQQIENPTPDFQRLTVSTEATFGTQLYQLAAAWAPVKPLRLGVSAGVASTTYKSNVALSGWTTPASATLPSAQLMSALRTNGSDNSIVFGLGAQWDVAAGLTVGAVVRPPGIRFGGSSLVTAESMQVAPTTATSTYFRDDKGEFQYKLPLEASLGVAYRFGAVELEFDLRFHDGVSTYDFYRGSKDYQIVTQGGGAAAPPPAPVIGYSARKVYNGALGANWHLSKLITLHGGFYNTQSPVADAATSPLRKADLYGFTGGADFQLSNFGASIGAGYQFGSSSPTGIDLAGTHLAAGDVSLSSISIIYAVSYQF